MARTGATRDTHGFEATGTFSFGDGEVRAYRLPNGLRLLYLEDRHAPVVSFFTWFRVGSRHEKPGKTGLAHLFEHLMFNEAEGLPAGRFDEKLEAAGAETNAATWLDWTYYYESLPASKLPLAIELEALRMEKLVLRDAQVSSELEVVANERRYRVDDDVEGAANELLYATAFDVHPYRNPTIGWMRDIKGFTPADCEAFYRTYYAPNNATLVVVGDVRERDVLRRVAAAYAHLPSAELPAEDTRPEPPRLAPRSLTVHKATAAEKLLVAFPGPALGDPDHPLLALLVEILLGGRASRLHARLVTELELVTDLRGWVSTFRDPGLFELSFSARPGKAVADVLPVLDAELERVREGLVTEDELTRAKGRIELGVLQSLETAAGKAEQIGFYDTVLLDPAGVLRRLESYRRADAGAIRTAARRWLRPEARTVLTVLPEPATAAAAAAPGESADAEGAS